MTTPPEWLRTLADAARSGALAEGFARWAVPVRSGARPSAVLLLFGEGPAGPDVLLIQRSDQLRTHAGQPAFPGGAQDPPDRDLVDTALREATEEVGLDRTGVRVLGTLPALYLPPSGFLVTPVLAWWEHPRPVGVMDPVEVARVERVPIAELADPANRCRVRHPSGHVGPAFTVRGMTVWGFTAALLDGVLTLGGWAVPWDTDDVRELPARVRELAARGRRQPARPVEPEDDAPAADDVVVEDPGGTGAPGNVNA